MQIGSSRQTNPLVLKLLVIGTLISVSWIPTLLIVGLVADRSNRADEARAEIATTWGREQTINGPIITIPTRTVTVQNDGKQIIHKDLIFLLPETLTYDVVLETQTLSRGIFDAVVYTGRIKGTGTVNLNEINSGDTARTIQWNDATFSIGIPDTRGITSSAELNWSGEKSVFEPGVPPMTVGIAGISAPVHISQNQKEHTFTFDLSLRGSEKIDFIPLGKTTSVNISSNWQSPSFSGEFLPKDRELTQTGFQASWLISSFGRSIPQSWSGTSAADTQTIQENMQKAAFGVSLHQGVDFYTQTNRTVKYSILFISLTFIAFFMFEILSRLRIHPMNYLLVGLAIALFYLLLLSLSEQIGFLPAYLASTLAITGLITGYCKSVLKANKRAGAITALLIALYSYLYILLQLDELSLIFGSILLFGVLTAAMYLTRNIDWYEISERR